MDDKTYKKFINNNFNLNILSKNDIDGISENDIIFYLRQFGTEMKGSKEEREFNILSLIKTKQISLINDIDGNNILTYAYFHKLKTIFSFIEENYIKNINTFDERKTKQTFSAILPYFTMSKEKYNLSYSETFNNLFNNKNLKKDIKTIILFDLMNRFFINKKNAVVVSESMEKVEEIINNFVIKHNNIIENKILEDAFRDKLHSIDIIVGFMNQFPNIINIEKVVDFYVKNKETIVFDKSIKENLILKYIENKDLLENIELDFIDVKKIDIDNVKKNKI